MTTETEFKIGDLVQLKSGGPRMTVEEIHEDGDVYCVWMSAITTTDDPWREYFKPFTITKNVSLGTGA